MVDLNEVPGYKLQPGLAGRIQTSALLIYAFILVRHSEKNMSFDYSGGTMLLMISAVFVIMAYYF